jgi:hypothetical protein
LYVAANVAFDLPNFVTTNGMCLGVVRYDLRISSHGRGRIMDGDWKSNWESMTIDDLFALREQVQEILRERLKAKQAELDRRLQALAPASTDVESIKEYGRRRVKGAHA